ncbi:unnamed protein product [Ceutorhynchus assimilis]|uniref:Uncharacterized protein n=1 Tax=Ceutorhynchus assimilis TaxID=467358 RepID=A0A9N9QN62_9CUCU|nr:unnamed protein product [Ceutorhynchus assimilis]
MSEHLNIPGYRIVRLDRVGQSGGGPLVYIRGDFHFKTLSFDVLVQTRVEQLWIPGAPIASLVAIEECIRQAYLTQDELVAIGDGNVDFLRSDCLLRRQLSQVFDCYGINQALKEPTRVSDQSSTLINIIAMTNFVSLLECGTADLLNLTDQRLTFCRLDFVIKSIKPRKVTFRNFRYFDTILFGQDASTVEWDFIQVIPYLSEKEQYLTNAVNFLFDMHAPFKSTIARRNPARPYITSTVKEMSKLKREA